MWIESGEHALSGYWRYATQGTPRGIAAKYVGDTTRMMIRDHIWSTSVDDWLTQCSRIYLVIYNAETNKINYSPGVLNEK
jgi:hypothetical protein